MLLDKSIRPMLVTYGSDDIDGDDQLILSKYTAFIHFVLKGYSINYILGGIFEAYTSPKIKGINKN